MYQLNIVYDKTVIILFIDNFGSNLFSIVLLLIYFPLFILTLFLVFIHSYKLYKKITNVFSLCLNF
jgi:hypothetical protein